jgi:hypothetical protein
MRFWHELLLPVSHLLRRTDSELPEMLVPARLRSVPWIPTASSSATKKLRPDKGTGRGSARAFERGARKAWRLSNSRGGWRSDDSSVTKERAARKPPRCESRRPALRPAKGLPRTSPSNPRMIDSTTAGSGSLSLCASAYSALKMSPASVVALIAAILRPMASVASCASSVQASASARPLSILTRAHSCSHSRTAT